MRLIFISSVTATRLLRTISVMTGSAAFLAAGLLAGAVLVTSSMISLSEA